MNFTNKLAYFYVCFSNFIGIPILFVETNPLLLTLVTLAMLASFTMHVLEADLFRGTATISALRKRSTYYWAHKFDILFAWPLVPLYGYLYLEEVLSIWYICLGAVLLCVVSTELPGAYKNPRRFALLHGSWHVLAFSIGTFLSSQKK